MVIVPYLALAPTIVTGAITLGFVQQITRAFGRVEGSLQYLVKKLVHNCRINFCLETIKRI